MSSGSRRPIRAETPPLGSVATRQTSEDEDARHPRLPTILEGVGVARAEGPASANEEAQGHCSCEENVENCAVVFTQAKEKLHDGLNCQIIEQSRNAPRNIIEIHGAANVVIASPN
jgi:hypothetical protein